MAGSRLESARVLFRKVTHSLGGGRWGSYTLPPTARTERRRTRSQPRDGVTEGSTHSQEHNDPAPEPNDRSVGKEGQFSGQSDRCSEQGAHHEDHPPIESEHNSDERPTVCIDSDQTSSAPSEASLSPRLDIRGSAKANGVSPPSQETSTETGSVSESAKQGSVHNKKKALTPPKPSSSGPGRSKSDAASSHEQRGRSKSFSDGSFLDRLPAAVVGEVTSPVITEGPHKPSPAAADLHRTAAVAPPRRRLSVPDGVLVGRPQTPPATENELDDAAASDVDSGTADVMDDLPSRGTPEPEEEEEEEEEREEHEEEDGGIRQEDHHRVVISITSSEPEIHGPLGCQEVPPVVVRLQLGDQGRYGFNVKGGAGSSIPVTVSKVAPRSATRCSGPRLSEGDQVVLINGVDVSNFTHREVVRFIKSCRDRQVELELTVKPNVNYDGHIDLEEPLVRYVPDTTPLTLSSSDNTAATLTLTPDATPLARSIAELAHALSRGIAQLEFDNLARRELSLTMDDCRLPENIAKNRYRDISPYDCSRVVLRTAESGDYINANFVNMEIPGSGIVNRYIAAQGPLHHTTDDFWAMVWEQKCPLVVMLTTLVEQGRVKCHQYWPDEGQTLLFGDFQVTTVSEEVTESFAFREITVQSQETGEERHLSHMQYVSWPDHGVPEQAADFVQFVQRVRSARAHHTAEEATVVHCSAGIGRTGVLILMETAMCLIEADQPVYPLELVRCMRRQRAMMIQTPSQFEFVCEAVVQAHHDGTVRPLSELDRPE